MQNPLIRSRWAAIGAALAVSLGAGGIGIGFALPTSGDQAVYEPITPCRLADTRAAPDTVGSRSTPIGADETYVLKGWGTVGNCTIPGEPTALALNVTAIGPTLPTFLTLFPADKALPKASHLNPAPGQPPTPNAVNVDLDGNGKFSIYNKQGTVDVIVDVVGLYTHHDHDGLYYTQAEVDTAVDRGKAVVESIQGDQNFSVTSPPMVQLGGTFYEEVRSVQIDPSSAGTVVAAASLSAAHDEEGGETMRAACGLATGDGLDSSDRLEFVLDDEDRVVVSPTRTFPVTGPGLITINLLCRTYTVDPFPPPGDPSTMTVRNSSLVLTYIPD